MRDLASMIYSNHSTPSNFVYSLSIFAPFWSKYPSSFSYQPDLDQELLCIFILLIYVDQVLTINRLIQQVLDIYEICSTYFNSVSHSDLFCFLCQDILSPGNNHHRIDRLFPSNSKNQGPKHQQLLYSKVILKHRSKPHIQPDIKLSKI